MGNTTIDIKTIDVDNIAKEEIFALDTNVLVWTHYSKASNPNINRHPYQVIEYPNFVGALLENGNTLVTTMLNITELCGVIERNEFRIYKAVNQCGSLGFKDYRKIINERIAYQNEIQHMISEIKSSYDGQIQVIDITDEIVEEYLKNINNNNCDIFDYIVINHLKSLNITNYISDDKDFSSIDGITLYTTSDT